METHGPGCRGRPRSEPPAAKAGAEASSSHASHALDPQHYCSSCGDRRGAEQTRWVAPAPVVGPNEGSAVPSHTSKCLLKSSSGSSRAQRRPGERQAKRGRGSRGLRALGGCGNA